jgi:hypothetical protein
MTHATLAALVAAALGCLAACNADDPATDAGAVDDAGGGDTTAPTTLDACFAGLTPRVDGRTVNVLDFTNDVGSLQLRLAREVGERTGVGETLGYDLVRFGIRSDDGLTCVTDAAALAYTFGHHNWDDYATATGTHSYVVHMAYSFESGGWTDTLVVDDGDPIVLTNTRCASIPTVDLNHCLMRDRDE